MHGGGAVTRRVEGTIYIVDDDPGVRDGLRRLLETYGYTVHAFATGPEFLVFQPHAEQACVLLDLGLPGMDGFAVLKSLRAAGRDVPVITMTAQPDREVRARALAAGAASFIAKPFPSGQLLAMVKRALRPVSGPSATRINC